MTNRNKEMENMISELKRQLAAAKEEVCGIWLSMFLALTVLFLPGTGAWKTSFLRDLHSKSSYTLVGVIFLV